jgi:hypothetical protein
MNLGYHSMSLVGDLICGFVCEGESLMTFEGGTGSAFNKDVTMHFTIKIVIIILLLVEKLY